MAARDLDSHNAEHPSNSKYALLHTPTTNLPYIALTTRSQEAIYLTELYPTDAPTHQAALSIESVNNALIGPPKPYTLADAEWWIEHVRSGKAELSLSCLRVGSPDEKGTGIGGVALVPHDEDGFTFLRSGEPMGEGNRDCNIGYWLHPEFQGRGIMKEAVRALVNWGRRECGVGDAILKVLETNLASRRVVEGMSEFIRVEGEKGVEWVEWPEKKGGGGKKKLLVWKWKK
ncbi:uncharacterized protein BP5553_05714 [Venustampulla echinocandica]|uniref:N-acetyltransferase domain-containing protein n=1 Tax=Venustampulla echinocandica TaxID=2656787 RepID=A0A370TLF0_9HELO|nr:uncharacterized protein BP5553_05714 [Venustampulla echinocandica]RDL36362.1 hypothetical protein BP5553_05714 [Venustampulla echinocandica]